MKVHFCVVGFEQVEPRPAHPYLYVSLLLPGRIDRLGKQKCGIGSRSRRELLYASCVYFREVQIALLVDAQPMYTPEVARIGTHAAPGVQQVALQVVLDHFVGGAIKGPEGASGSDVEQVKTRRRSVNLPFVAILAVFIEDLDAVIVPIVHENVFFFSSRGRHTRSLRDWSSDVCSSDPPTWRLGFAHAPSKAHHSMVPATW